VTSPGERLRELGLALPPPMEPPSGTRLPFAWSRVAGSRLILSGHGPQAPDGRLTGPFGQVGVQVSEEEAYAVARLIALSMFGTIQRAIDDLDRVTAWLRVFGMVSSAPGFERQPAVINGFSDLVLDVFGPEIGTHARSAVGMAALPFGLPVEIEAEVAFA
jgi:enamine deaminase RidA (YjgF/YER057c/UK114 family)